MEQVESPANTETTSPKPSQYRCTTCLELLENSRHYHKLPIVVSYRLSNGSYTEWVPSTAGGASFGEYNTFFWEGCNTYNAYTSETYLDGKD